MICIASMRVHFTQLTSLKQLNRNSIQFREFFGRVRDNKRVLSFQQIRGFSEEDRETVNERNFDGSSETGSEYLDRILLTASFRTKQELMQDFDEHYYPNLLLKAYAQNNRARQKFFKIGLENILNDSSSQKELIGIVGDVIYYENKKVRDFKVKCDIATDLGIVFEENKDILHKLMTTKDEQVFFIFVKYIGICTGAQRKLLLSKYLEILQSDKDNFIDSLRKPSKLAFLIKIFKKGKLEQKKLFLLLLLNNKELINEVSTEKVKSELIFLVKTIEKGDKTLSNAAGFIEFRDFLLSSSDKLKTSYEEVQKPLNELSFDEILDFKNHNLLINLIKEERDGMHIDKFIDFLITNIKKSPEKSHKCFKFFEKVLNKRNFNLPFNTTAQIQTLFETNLLIFLASKQNMTPLKNLIYESSKKIQQTYFPSIVKGLEKTYKTKREYSVRLLKAILKAEEQHKYRSYTTLIHVMLMKDVIRDNILLQSLFKDKLTKLIDHKIEVINFLYNVDQSFYEKMFNDAREEFGNFLVTLCHLIEKNDISLTEEESQSLIHLKRGLKKTYKIQFKQLPIR